MTGRDVGPKYLYKSIHICYTGAPNPLLFDNLVSQRSALGCRSWVAVRAQAIRRVRIGKQVRKNPGVNFAHVRIPAKKPPVPRGHFSPAAASRSVIHLNSPHFARE
jgi:hypothetical protein